MADLFTITAPLLVRLPDGTRHVMVEVFSHPEGLVYFRPFWDLMSPEQGIRLLSGVIRGEGPWKVGDAVVTVLGCQGSSPDEAAEYSNWQWHRQQLGDRYPAREDLEQMACATLPGST